MFTVGAGTTIATISELRSNAKQTLAASKTQPVVVIVDGQPAGALISMEKFAELQELEENARIARLAARRLERVRSGEDQLLEHDDFWAAARARAVTAPRR